MTILYMCCASFMVKYSATTMQSVNIHIIKIFNKTCRWVIKILGLICTFSKLFFVLSVFYFSLFLPPIPAKQRTAPWKVLKAREWLSLWSMCCPWPQFFAGIAQCFLFLRHNFFLMKWCVDFNLIPAHLNDRGVIIPPAAEELSALTWNLHAENSLACQ